jgi:hypothetical protein
LDTRALVARRRKKNDRDEAILRDGLDDSARIDSVQPGHIDVEHHEVDGLGANRIDRLLAVACGDDHQPALAEQLSYMLARRAIIIGDDHHRLWKWTGRPHHDTITERGQIREP